MGNFNALDMWIWYSLFQNNADGVTNYPGAGNFHVYNSIFENSSTADIRIGNAGVFNFRNNYSTGSGQFIRAGGACAPYNVTVQGNTVLDTTNPLSVQLQGLGPMVAIDNIVRSAANVTSGPVVVVNDCGAGDLFSMGNTFTAGTGSCTTTAPAYGDGHCHEINDQVVARSTINPTIPTLPGTPPNNHRQIFEVAPGSTAAQIQAAINNAAASGTTRPVVHIQPGSYSINMTLVLPAGSDMQIIGDGSYSQLNAAAALAGSPVMRLLGPSKAILRDFVVNGDANTADGIEVDNADQPGSRVFMEQAILGGSHTNLFVDGLDYTNVELHDFNHVYDATTGMTSVNVRGGRMPQPVFGKAARPTSSPARHPEITLATACRTAHMSRYGISGTTPARARRSPILSGASTFTYAGSRCICPVVPHFPFLSTISRARLHSPISPRMAT